MLLNKASKIKDKTDKESLALARIAMNLSEIDNAETILLELIESGYSSINAEAWNLLLRAEILKEKKEGEESLRKKIAILKKNSSNSLSARTLIKAMKMALNLSEIQWGKDSESPVLTDLEISYDDNLSNKQDIIDLMGKTGQVATIYKLIEMLNDEDYEIKVRAAYSIGLIGETELSRPFINLLSSPDKRMKEVAVWLLGFSHAEDARDTLNSILNGMDNGKIKGLACLALAHNRKFDKNNDDIVFSLRNPYKAVRKSCAWALGFLKDNSAINELKNALNLSADDDESSVIIWAILRAGSENAKKEILKYLWSNARDRIMDIIIDSWKIQNNDEIEKFEKIYYRKLLDPVDGSLELKQFPLPPLTNITVMSQEKILKEFLDEEKDLLTDIISQIIKNGTDQEKINIARDLCGEAGYFGGPFSRLSLLTYGKGEMTDIAGQYYQALKELAEKVLVSTDKENVKKSLTNLIKKGNKKLLNIGGSNESNIKD